MLDDYFESIDQPNKAYILGFIAGDGCLLDNGRLTICLNDKDEDILYKIKQNLMCDNKLYFYTPHNRVSLSITNRKINKDLIRHGITPRKSLTIKYPTIQKTLERHFIRGLVDADGWISIHKNKIHLGLCGSEEIVLGFNNFCYDICKKHYSISRDNNTYTSAACGINALMIMEQLYWNSEIHLNRKYKKFLEAQTLV